MMNKELLSKLKLAEKLIGQGESPHSEQGSKACRGYVLLGEIIAALESDAVSVAGQSGVAEKNQFNPFPRLVRITRARLNLTIREFSKVIGLTAQRVSELETAHGSPPSDDEVESYSKVFSALRQPVETMGDWDWIPVEKGLPQIEGPGYFIPVVIRAVYEVGTLGIDDREVKHDSFAEYGHDSETGEIGFFETDIPGNRVCGDVVMWQYAPGYALRTKPQSPGVYMEDVCQNCEGVPTGGHCNMCNGSGIIVSFAPTSQPQAPAWDEIEEGIERLIREWGAVQIFCDKGSRVIQYEIGDDDVGMPPVETLSGKTIADALNITATQPQASVVGMLTVEELKKWVRRMGWCHRGNVDPSNEYLEPMNIHGFFTELHAFLISRTVGR